MTESAPFLSPRLEFVQLTPAPVPVESDSGRVMGPRIEHTVLLFLLLLQFKWYGPLLGSEGNRLEIYDLVYVLWLIQVWFTVANGNARFLQCKSQLALVAFLVWSGFVTAIAIGTDWSATSASMLTGWLRFLQLASLAFIIPTLARTRRQVDAIYKVVFALAGLQFLLAAIRQPLFVVSGIDWTSVAASLSDNTPLKSQGSPSLLGRWGGSFGDPAKLGNLLVLGVCWAWAQQIARSRMSGRWTLAAVLLSMGVFFTRTRASLAGLILSLIGAAAWQIYRRKGFRSSIAVVIAGTAFMAVLVAAGQGGMDDFLRLQDDDTFRGRMSSIESDLGLAQEHLLIGVGWSGARFFAADYAAGWGAPLYTRVLAELGSGGLLLLLLFFYTVVCESWRLSARLHAGPGPMWVFLSSLGFIGMAVGDVIFYGASHTTLTLFLAIGLLAAECGIMRSTRPCLQP